jgi:hypothetical protein
MPTTSLRPCREAAQFNEVAGANAGWRLQFAEKVFVVQRRSSGVAQLFSFGIRRNYDRLLWTGL